MVHGIALRLALGMAALSMDLGLTLNWIDPESPNDPWSNSTTAPPSATTFPSGSLREPDSVCDFRYFLPCPAVR